MFMGRPHPQVPDFPPGLRSATAHDVSSMVDISIKAFRPSEIFEYIRPYYARHHDDTRQSLRSFYQSRLQSLNSLMVVAEVDGQVVGFIYWHLPDGSPRVGQFSLFDLQIDDP